MSRPFTMRAEDLSAGAIEEFTHRYPWSFYRLPRWSFKNPSKRYVNREAMRNLRKRVKLEAK